MKNKVGFGYEKRDGGNFPHPIESEIVKFIYEKHNEYCEHPPKDLVLNKRD